MSIRDKIKINHKYILLLLAFIFILLFPLLIGNSFTSYKFFMDKWDNCLEYFGQGTLYGGQPLCIQVPVLYMISYPFTIFGYYFDFAITCLSFLFIFLIFIYGNKIIKKESKQSLFLYTLLFCFLFLYFSLARFASLLGTAFFFFAFYILFYTKIKHKKVYSGILFALSVFSKFNYIVFVFISILYYLFYNLRILKEFKYQKLKKIIPLIIPTIILFIFFEIKWPNFATYIFFTPLKTVFLNRPISVYPTLKYIFSFDPLKILILSILLFSAVSFFKNKKAIASISSFGLLIMYLIFSRVMYRHYLPALLFFVILFVIEFNLIKKNYIKYTLLIFLLLLFLVPLSKDLYLNFKFNSISHLTNNVLEKFPVPEGEILGDRSYFELKIQGFNIDKDNYTYLGHPGVSVIDPYSEVLDLYGVYHPKEWENYQTKLFEKFSKEIISSKYSLILFSQGDYPTDLSSSLVKAFENNDLLFEKYCVFKILNLRKEGSINFEPAIYLFLKRSEGKCEFYNKIIYNYYQEHFPKICEKSSIAGLLTKVVLISNGDKRYTSLKCKYNKGDDILLKYYDKVFTLPKQKELNLNNISECYVLKNNQKIGIGKLCNNVDDCKTNSEKDTKYFCEKSQLFFVYPLKVCSTVQNCESFFDNEKFYNFLECDKNICMYLGSFNSIGSITHSHNAFFSGANFYLQNYMVTKEELLNVVREYVN